MFVCSFVKCVKTILYNCLVSFNFQCVRLCEWERHKHIKKNYRHEHRRIMSSSAGFGFFYLLSLRTQLRQDCSLILLWSLSIVDQFWSFFFFFKIKVFEDKSVWSWKLAWMSALLCPLNFASSFIRNSHHQYVFFFSFPPFIRLNETHSSSFSIFSCLFLLFFMCVCVTMSLPDDCQRGHMARNTCADNAKKKLIQEQQEAWFF